MSVATGASTVARVKDGGPSILLRLVADVGGVGSFLVWEVRAP